MQNVPRAELCVESFILKHLISVSIVGTFMNNVSSLNSGYPCRVWPPRNIEGELDELYVDLHKMEINAWSLNSSYSCRVWPQRNIEGKLDELYADLHKMEINVWTRDLTIAQKIWLLNSFERYFFPKFCKLKGNTRSTLNYLLLQVTTITSIHKFSLSGCLFVCFYPINVKTAEPIKPKFCVGPHVTPKKVYEW